MLQSQDNTNYDNMQSSQKIAISIYDENENLRMVRVYEEKEVEQKEQQLKEQEQQ